MNCKKNVVGLLVVLIMIGTTTPHQYAAGRINPQLEAKILQVLKEEPSLEGAIAGISLRQASTGEVIFQHNGDIRLKPASNLKLLTAAAALEVLGENYQFTTNLYIDGKIKKKTLSGNLVLQGKGDPTLMKDDFDKFATKVKEAGIKVINGDLIGDDSWYDDVRYSLDMPWSDEETYYGAQISALTASPDQDYDAGTVIVDVTPGNEIGSTPSISLTPNTQFIKVVNEAVTISPDGKQELMFKREHGTNIVKVSGSIPLKSKPTREWVGVWEPTLYALELFKQSLEEKGIILNGKIKKGNASNSAKNIVTRRSIPLSELILPFIKLSNNGHAETLIKEMGRVEKGKGSWEKGLIVMKEALHKLGLNPDTLVIRDGSGISHADLIPAHELTKLLFLVQKERWFPILLRSLPVSGNKTKEIGGTLRRRMADPALVGKIKAKTGTISTVSSLSGYAETKNGEVIIFAILLNNLIDEEKGKAIEDRLVSILIE
ncbi:D-alanyl-D-alanine carboxypeptidase/D-alanyl-D-alanine-endopeptidase [Bacillus sp. DNRA2]|uniref:D-alanyl-D-alanine carboxypeptidase/D-alanyl-D-alanine endopeptidase n=1 Tax=Bacillus sp. DNRA2 TaxID=2723053 RepID=UPI00145E15E3|nr:D-alanyl-D-alanine carboxypeptidase/D-alanyl-D-alanine-endopeptidase [Bacillus sp. DNRA2]NMD69872.1 D-alanyl-D-alanine carboxypeptidase/D-alanyl-D-alanine-endopeptidase [Bacillus sp. DNRA2]